MKKKRIGQCYLCGTIGKMTQEHLPSQCLSPETPKSGFFFVPACSNCNNKYSHEESKFRDYLVTASAGKGNKSADKAYQAMRRNFMRNPIGRVGRPHKDLIRIVKNISKKDFFSPDGKIYLGTGRIISSPDDLDIESVLIKIVRGLHFLHTKEIIPSSYIMHAKIIKHIEHPELFEDAKIKGKVGDFFHFRGGWAKEDNKSGLWYMLFYQTIGAMAWFIDSTMLKNKPTH